MAYYSILVTGTKPSDKRVIERALYDTWYLTGWTESDKGFAVLVETDVRELDPTYMIGRLQSFGSWGVRFRPLPEDIITAVGRIRP